MRSQSRLDSFQTVRTLCYKVHLEHLNFISFLDFSLPSAEDRPQTTIPSEENLKNSNSDETFFRVETPSCTLHFYTDLVKRATDKLQFARDRFDSRQEPIELTHSEC